MILSVLHLSRGDIQKIKGRNARVFDTYTIHKLVYSLFPKEDGEARSFLFAYKGGDFNEERFLILSKNYPVQPEIGTIESKEIPKTFLEQEYYGFEVIINPVKRNGKTKKIIPIRGREEIMSWFIEKSGSYGFEVMPESLSVSDTHVLQFTKDNKNVVLGKAKCVGRLRVTNRELFIKAFENGLGKGKAFGFGLLQIIPLIKQ